jgi:uncharacterized protein (PEP-CTERM system associated)
MNGLRGCAGAVLAAWMMPALAQDAPRGWRLVPTLGVEETYTRATRRTVDDPRGEFTTRVTPGLQLTGQSSRIKATLLYSVNISDYSQHSSARSIENTLAGQATAELVPNWVFTEVQASIGQQAASAYGEQTLADSTRASSNRTEVGTLTIQPYMRGTLAGLAAYELRLTSSTTQVRRSADGDSNTLGGRFSLGSLSQQARFGWTLSGSNEKVDYKMGATVESDRLNAAVFASPDTDLRLTLSAGREYSNATQTDRRTTNNVGLGLRWTPGERTRVELSRERRYYGQSHSYLFEHRMRRSALHYIDTESASTDNLTGPNTGRQVTWYALLDAELTALYPDPAQRQQQVLAQLSARGLNANGLTSSGSITSAPTVQHRRELGLTITGVRDTINLLAFTNSQNRIDSTTTAPDDANSRQNGWTLILTHRLTPTAGLNLSASGQRTLGTEFKAGNDLKSISATWSDQVSRTSSASLSMRYSRFDSTIDPYREAALTASVSTRF